MLRKNPGLDVRQVLGTDSKRIFTYLCNGIVQGRKIEYKARRQISEGDEINYDQCLEIEVTPERENDIKQNSKDELIISIQNSEEIKNDKVDEYEYDHELDHMSIIPRSSLTPIPIAFQSIPSIICEKNIRDLLFQYLKKSITYCKAAAGFIFYNSQLFINCYNTELFDSFTISTNDILLLSMFITGSVELTSDTYKTESNSELNSSYNPSNQNNDNTKSGGGSPLVQHWVPVCLPSVNDKGFLQAYITPLFINGNNEKKVTSTPGTPIPTSPVNNIGKNFNFDNIEIPDTKTSKDFNEEPLSSLTMILIAAEADPDMFTNFARAQRFMQKVIKNYF